MQSGVINSDNFSQVLRGLSQRRRQGVLEINYGDSNIALEFYHGKIVEVLDYENNQYEEVHRILLNAGYVNDASLPILKNYSELFVYLSENCCEDGFLDEEIFRRAVRSRLLNRLYQLDFTTNAFYSFKTRMVEVDHDFGASVTVGQLLLDQVALDSDREKFEEYFSDATVITSNPVQELALSDEEGIIYNMAKTPVTVAEVKRCSLLSAYHLQDSLLAMLEKGIISIDVKELSSLHGETLNQDLNVDALLDTFEDAIDESFQQVSKNIEEVLGHVGPAPSVVERDITSIETEGEVVEHHPHDAVVQHTPARVKLLALNARMLQMNWIIDVVVFIFLAAALLVPMLFWENIFRYFGGIAP
ncbi:MAG: hypothetical protein D6719_07715 [Candidatus Dadabacteria bacterium]|nr:MAG: hypothetical protein D6719_07715 [Candidatus Dadabacteria bacterium]